MSQFVHVASAYQGVSFVMAKMMPPADAVIAVAITSRWTMSSEAGAPRFEDTAKATSERYFIT